jgi:hypothetical protein
MTDLVGRWRSTEFLAAVTGWVDDALGTAGWRRTGPLTERKVRFWAAVHEVPVVRADREGVDLGERAFVKIGNPGQAFEGELLAALARLAPGSTVTPWAVDPTRGWWLLPDAGPTPEPTAGVWAECLGLAARLQRTCAPHQHELAVVPLLDTDTAVDHAVRTVESLALLPPGHAQHLDAERARALLAGVGRLTAAMSVLRGTGLPTTLQPNDVHPGNAGRGPDGRLRLFDLGDAFRSHPWAVLSAPLRTAGGTRLRDPLPDTATVRRLLDRYAEHWPEVDRADRAEVLRAADRLGALHRAASWERLLAPADPGRLGVPTPVVADWLALALA